MQRFPATPAEMLASLHRNRHLILALTRREIAARYRGSRLGMLWSFVNPLLMLGVYSFVFSVVFKARWGGTGGGSPAEFALVLFTGLVVFSLFAECISKAPGLVVGNTSYVKRVVFPLEVLPVVTLLGALFNVLVSLLVWLLFHCVFFGVPPLTALLLPLLLLPLVLLVLGATWLLSALAVYLRDVAQFVGVITTALLFLSPVFYPLSAIPEAYRYLILLNPLTPVIEQVRQALVWGELPDPLFWLAYLALSGVFAWAGFAGFQKTRKGFADVL